MPAALEYYETVGQNWERAAFIKARAMAGDGKEVNDGYVYLWSSTPVPASKGVAYLDITSGAVGMRAPGSWAKQVLLVR